MCYVSYKFGTTGQSFMGGVGSHQHCEVKLHWSLAAGSFAALFVASLSLGKEIPEMAPMAPTKANRTWT